MDKIKDIQELVGAQEIGDLIEPDWEGMVDIADGCLTPFGQFIIKLERILHRDDEVIKQLLKQWSEDKDVNNA